jgi:hypothetical protein
MKAWTGALALSAMTAAAQTAPDVAFDAKGLASLKVAGTEILAVPAPVVHSVVLEARTFRDGKREETFATVTNAPSASVWDAASRTLEQTYPWGKARWTYTPAPAGLRIALTLVNETSETIARFATTPLALAFPEPPSDLKPNGLVKRTLDNLVVIPVTWGKEKMLACMETLAPPVRFGFGKAADKEKRTFPLTLGGGVWAFEPGAVEVHLHGLPRVAAGATATFAFSLRFAAADTPAEQLDADLAAAFARLHKPTLDWPDRRSIGTIFLPSRGGLAEKNPRGWFNEAALDVTTPEGVETFRKKMLDFAARGATEMKKMEGQGVIVWNVEGEENPHPISYIGDPRMLRLLAPEMDAVADEFFQVFRDAGLRTGVTIRPTQVYFDEKEKKWKHGTGSHMDGRNPLNDDLDKLRPEGLPQWRFFPVVERMSRKIRYAQERWGCTLFYIDTNGIFVPVGVPHVFEWMLLDAQLLKELHARHPDVLLIPELVQDKWAFRVAYWACCAPYDQADYTKRTSTPPYVRRLFPGAFEVNHIANTKPADLAAWTPRFIEAVRGGDILMHRGWFACSVNKWVKAYYEAAALLPPERTPSGAELFAAVEAAKRAREGARP